jgi:hypothetical protein
MGFDENPREMHRVGSTSTDSFTEFSWSGMIAYSTDPFDRSLLHFSWQRPRDSD